MPLPEPGETLLGKYRIESRLGTGGMGTVFAANDVRLGGLVALKFLLPDLAARPDLAQRFLQEARAGRSLTSAHVAKVHDIDTFGDVPFIVMDHLEGETLAATLARRGRLPVPEAIDLLLEACEPVSEAHSLGIVHRDLKPANLFLARDKRGATSLKVLDFGISKFEDVAATSSESHLGTPLYMSPEQIDDSGRVDARTDVWSLAVVLFELLTGRRPFEGSSRSAIHVAIKSGRRPRLRDLDAEIPPRLEAALERGLALSPDDRFPSVEEFAAEIAQFGTRASAASLEHIQRVAEQASAPRSQAPAPLAPVDTAAGRELTSLAGSVAGTPPPPTPAPPPKARPRLVAGVVAVALVAGLGAVGARLRGFSGGADATTHPRATACAEGATAACEASCTANEPGACHALARALEAGKGAPANPARAFTLYQAECDGGGLLGCNNLGNLYDLGKGVGQDHKKALELFQTACKGDVAPACVNLGNLFLSGSVVEPNGEQAARFYRRACDDGEPLGCDNLSVVYTEGRGGMPPNLTRGFEYADLACSKGAPKGCVRAARLKIEGRGTAKDVKGGVGQLDAMCTRGVVEGCTALAAIYDAGLGDVAIDKVESATYVKKACDLHDVTSCALQATQKTIDDTSTNPGRFYAMLREQCLAGNAAACEQYGRSAIAGTGVPKDPAVGAEFLKRACAGGRGAACEGAPVPSARR